MKNKTVTIIVSILLMLAAGYFWYTHEMKARQAQLIDRVNAYWEAIRINDLYTAYNMEASAISGFATPDQVELQRDFNASITGYSVGDVLFYGDHAEIEIKTQMTMPDFEGKSFSAGGRKDSWTYMRGEWYHGSPISLSRNIKKRDSIPPGETSGKEAGTPTGI
jgi:hypothetical protein